MSNPPKESDLAPHNLLQAFGVIGPMGKMVGIANPRQRRVCPMADIQHRDICIISIH
jgi:hypothetical protein